MLNQARDFLELLKEWWELSLFLATTIFVAIVKMVKRYRMIRTTAYKVEAIENILKNEIVTTVVCTAIHDTCHNLNEVRFAQGQKEFDEIKGHYAKLDARIDLIMNTMQSNQAQTYNMMIKISQHMNVEEEKDATNNKVQPVAQSTKIRRDEVYTR